MSEESRKKMCFFVLVTAAIFFLAICFFRQHKKEKLESLVLPDWCEEAYLPVNPYSRPGTNRGEVRNIVVHYVANPKTTAEENRNYFASMADGSMEERRSVSSHFIIGLEGEILCCVPVQEVAYANYPRNEDTISIECCHPDASGRFTKETEESLIRLVSWLCQSLNLKASDVIRHYDVSGKNCPKYYVEHEDAWTALKKRISD